VEEGSPARALTTRGRSGDVRQAGRRRDITPKLAAQRLANSRLLWRERRIEEIFRNGGPRLFAELLHELIRHGLVDDATLDEKLGRYAAIDPAALTITGRQLSRGMARSPPDHIGGVIVMTDYPPSVLLARLYERTSAKGTRYFVGRRPDDRLDPVFPERRG